MATLTSELMAQIAGCRCSSKKDGVSAIHLLSSLGHWWLNGDHRESYTPELSPHQRLQSMSEVKWSADSLSFLWWVIALCAFLQQKDELSVPRLFAFQSLSSEKLAGH